MEFNNDYIALKDIAVGRTVAGCDTSQLPEEIRLAAVAGCRAMELLDEIKNYAGKAIGKRAKRERERERARAAAPTVVGFKPNGKWSAEEEAKLLAGFTTVGDIARLAVAHNRTPLAVAIRLNKLGKIDDAQLEAVRAYLAPQKIAA